jgi:hypothetical protein
VAVLCMADAGDDASGGARSEARGQSVWWNFLYIFLIILTVNRIKIAGGVDPLLIMRNRSGVYCTSGWCAGVVGGLLAGARVVLGRPRYVRHSFLFFF